MISITPLPIDDNTISRALEFLKPGSHVIAFLHNELVLRIQADRNKLETAEGQDVIALQQRLRATRDLLEFVHNPQPPKK
jgi:hypothetical protein